MSYTTKEYNKMKVKAMRPKRVECTDCKHFIEPIFEGKDKFDFGRMEVSAKCKLGKRVMFRMPVDYNDYGGYFRYCNEFVKYESELC